jgi:hypothetical protein
MVFSSNATKKSIVERSYFYAFGDSLDHSTSWPLADVTASSNENVQDIAAKIWRSSSTWQFDDSNQTDLPFSTTTLVVGQQDYSIPTTVFQVLAVEILDNNGDWIRIPQRDISESNLDFMSAGNSAGMPQEYDLVGNSVILDRTPLASSCTLVDGLKIITTREATTFTTPATYTTSDTTQPGFDEAFHKLVPIKNAYDWFLANGDSAKCATLLNEINGLEQLLASHYGRKNADKKLGIRMRQEDYF